MKKLRVWYNDKLVGEILKEPQGRAFVFTYAPSWLQDKSSFAISLSLPLTVSPHSPELSFAFFDNLLPEELIRQKIADQSGLNFQDSFGLLELFGAECSGALSILVESKQPVLKAKREPINKAQLSNHIVERCNLFSDAIQQGQNISMSIAGAQAKIPLIFSNDGYFLPIHETPSTHILKIPSTTFSNLVQNELFCMGLASYAGLSVPNFSLTNTYPSAFLIERYDRIIDNKGDSTIKLHQEDFCQALGLESTHKYQKQKAKVSLSKCFDVLQHVQNPYEDRKKLVQWVIFNVLIGNYDAHAKNISLLYIKGQKPSLAPFYDLVSTMPYNLPHKLALKIGGKNNVDYLTSSAWRKLQQESVINEKDFKDIALSLVLTMQDSVERLRDEFIKHYGAFDGLRVIEDTIKVRCKKFYDIFLSL